MFGSESNEAMLHHYQWGASSLRRTITKKTNDCFSQTEYNRECDKEFLCNIKTQRKRKDL